MATVTFSYRSKKDTTFLEARLSYRIAGNPNPISFYTRSKMEVSKDFWNDYSKNTKFKDVDKINLKKEIDDHTHELRKYLLNEFDKTDLSQVNKDWFKNIVHLYYNPPQPEVKDEIPTNLLEYWDYYLDLRKHEFEGKKRSLLKWITVQNKVKAFQYAKKVKFEIKDVNDNFKNDFIAYCKKQSYSAYTIQKEFSYIKTLCVHARTKGIETSIELDTLKVKLTKHEVPKVYLSFEDLEKISNLDNLPDYLDTARDWLVISCYTGQRISDFMRFDKSMIRKVKGKQFLDIKQQKTSKSVTVPLLPEVETILKKRNGNFPKRQLDQKYNNHIKEVARIAGLNAPTYGGLNINMRKVLGEYPKYELVTSHIGRRSFATNYYGKIPTSYLKDITGHGTEQMLLGYLGKSSKDTAFEAYELLMNVKK